MRTFVQTPEDKFEEAFDIVSAECGEDFCENCGDCLSCYGGDPCYHNDEKPHEWYIELGDPRNPYTRKT